ncbi:MAG TPA: DJ-1 family glyoxalase III [Solimonas sp.]|nr:DJ-1 family glyoxalase III [Solimonas sp.]
MSVLVPVAHGSESLETVAILNVLRRAEVAVTLASIESGLVVEGTRGIKLTADVLFGAVAAQDFDMIVLPGGEKGAQALGAHKALVEKLRKQRMAHKWYAAICASPALVLAPHELLDGKKATCYPVFRDKLIHYVDQPVVVDGHCITSQGPATAIAFALTLVERLRGKPSRDEVARQMLAQQA